MVTCAKNAGVRNNQQGEEFEPAGEHRNRAYPGLVVGQRFVGCRRADLRLSPGPVLLMHAITAVKAVVGSSPLAPAAAGTSSRSHAGAIDRHEKARTAYTIWFGADGPPNLTGTCALGRISF